MTADPRKTDAPETHPVSALVDSARDWVSEALSGWINGQDGKVAAAAPLAVEHFGKAVLWSKNPALLVPLDRKHESSLLALTRGTDLANPTLRTIGLSDVLERLSKVLDDDLPINNNRKRRFIDCRNGAIHAGGTDSELARHVLGDALALLNWLIPELESPALFYRDSLHLVEQLLEERRSAVEDTVIRKIAHGQDAFYRLRETVGDSDLFDETLSSMEALHMQRFEIAKDPPLWMLEDICPACKCGAVLVGQVLIDADMEISLEDGEPYMNAWWVFDFTPTGLNCAVCKLNLTGPEELAAASIRSGRFRLTVDDGLDELIEYANESDPSSES